MYDLVEDSRDILEINPWLAFEDRDQFDPIDDGWITVYRTGHKTTDVGSEVVDQGFRVHCFLVDQEDLDAFSGIEPYGEIPKFDFYPMAYGSRRGEEYWEEDLTQCIDGREAKRFVMKFTKDAPLVDTGFVEYHKLVEREKRNFERYDTDEKVVRFPADKWNYLSSQSDHWGLDDTILSLEVRASFLKDYLQERGSALVLAYFQSRDVKSTEEDIQLPDEDRESFGILGGKATRGVRRTMPGYELHWFCPIHPSDIPYSHEETLRESRENLKFETKQGYRFSKQEAMREDGFEEAGYRRPAIGAEDVDEALNYFGWTFFDPEVLEKYRSDSRGSVSEWSRQGLQIEWLDKMSLRAYRNDEDLIVIIVDDLAKIPDEEIPHWYQHNTSPRGEIPEEMITNYIKAEFVDSESPAQAVINAVTELDTAFQEAYGQRLYRETGEELDAERLMTLPRNEREALLDVMSKVDEVVVENLDKGNLEAQLPDDVDEDDIEGEKSALWEFVRELSDTDKANEILTPINSVHDFRQEDSHRRVTGGWSRAVQAIGYPEDSTGFREIYRDTLRDTAASLREIIDLIEEQN
ncbi:hypothetical protein [Halorubrum salinum]|uniref:hypothetical protein n=1 Tax=Halorubrum salinum TaxID=767517 RepID=UPI0021119FCC|nr:hypothetical protein [Halorubrum salinum]